MNDRNIPFQKARGYVNKNKDVSITGKLVSKLKKAVRSAKHSDKVEGIQQTKLPKQLTEDVLRHLERQEALLEELIKTQRRLDQCNCQDHKRRRTV